MTPSPSNSNQPSHQPKRSPRRYRPAILSKNRLRPHPDELSKSVGAIVLNKRLHTLLIFQEQNRYWEFPKGKVEPGERELDTLRRELREETGITRYRIWPQFRVIVYYDFHHEERLIRRKVVYYLISTNDRVRISDEHTEYVWLSLSRAKTRLRHENHLQLLTAVERRLQHRLRRSTPSTPSSSQVNSTS